MRRYVCILVVTLLGLFACQGCGDDGGGPATGTEGGPCYPNGTCNAGLECRSDVCVALPCQPGTSQPCTCPGGGSGGQICDANGVWGECECDAVCGDGILEALEQCDGSDLGEQTCLTAAGHQDGTLGCASDCLSLDTSECYTCGDQNVDGPEACDTDNFVGETCQTQASHQHGALGCASDCLTIDTSQCHTCGNTTIEGPEECDGTELGGATCVSIGQSGGTLACAVDCQFDESGCFYCGNGLCEAAAGENRANCLQDCGWTRISAGNGYTCALGDGTAWCWGMNDHGQLGDGTTTYRSTPVQVSGSPEFVVIRAGNLHTCAILSDGTAWCWGSNNSGQLGDGSTHQDCGGDDCSQIPVQVSGVSDVVSIYAGGQHACAAKADGTAWCWGSGGAGQLGDGAQMPQNTPVQVSGLSNVVSISAGAMHSCGKKGDGTAWCWGWNTYGQLGDGTTTNRLTPVQVAGLSNVVTLDSGYGHNCVAKGDGTAWCWGTNGLGQLGDGTQTDRHTPVQVSSLANVVSVCGSVQGSHTCAARGDGTAWCWGNNSNGQLGDGTTTNRLTPVQVSGLLNVVSISAGMTHTCAAKGDGTSWCWGSTFGTTPVQVANP